MDIIFTKISDQQHSVAVRRGDGSTESVVLDSRSFLRHDLAHLAVESEVPLLKGFWGLLASGASLCGEGMHGPELTLAESLAGPVQTMLRLESDVPKYLELLQRVLPQEASMELAQRIHEKGRKLQGHWRATPYKGEMRISWP